MDKKNLFSEFLGITDMDGMSQLVVRLNEKHFTKKDFPVTYKTMHVWAREGLFPEEKAEERDWRRFSFIEYVWMNLIIRLKSFGMSTESILMAKKFLLEPLRVSQMVELAEYLLGDESQKQMSAQEKKSFQALPKDFMDELKAYNKEHKDEKLPDLTILTMIVSHYVTTRRNVCFLVTHEGKVFPWVEEKKDYYEKAGVSSLKENDHISISLANLVKEYIMVEKTEPEPRVQLLTEEEQEVIRYIREKKLTELTIRFDDKHRISLLEAKEKLNAVDVEARYIDHLLKSGYQDVSYTTQGGKIVSFHRTTKKRISKKEAV